jgi:CRP/FNR family cyclic AMP-dependent transcriptional regulator
VAIAAERKRELLARLPLFANLAPREIEALAAVARSRSIASREELFHKGDAGTQVYAVVGGTLKVVTTSEAGDDVVLNLLGPGAVIGEVAVLCNAERSASVVALTDCELLAIERRDLLAFLRSHPDASLALMSVLAQRLRSLSELVEDTLFLNLPVRLAKKLVALGQSHGQRTPEGLRIDLKLSQGEWGDLVGATRESINKQLRTWSDACLVRLDQGYLVLRRPERLASLAEASGRGRGD